MSKPRRKRRRINLGLVPSPRGVKEHAQIRGDWAISVVGPDGKVKEKREVQNLVVNDGLDWIADYAFTGCNPTTQPDAMCYIAIGTDGTAVTATDTALGAELVRETFETVTSGGTGVITYDVTFAAGVGTGAVSEAGTFNDASAGEMFNRVAFSAVNKTASDTLKVSCTITFTSS